MQVSQRLGRAANQGGRADGNRKQRGFRALTSINVGALLMVIALDSPVFGCDCVRAGSPKAEAAASATVFVGEVVERSFLESSADNAAVYITGTRLRFRVLDMIKPVGKNRNQGQVELLTGLGGGDCGLVAPVGSLFLIYAFRKDGADALHTSICTRSTPLVCASEDLKKLGRKNPPYLKTTIASLDLEDPEEMGQLPCVPRPELLSDDDLNWPPAIPGQAVPSYPLMVQLTLTIGTSGNVLDIHIDSILGEGEFPEFRQEVLGKVKGWKFRPATYLGRSVPVRTWWLLSRLESKKAANPRPAADG